eukprot:GHRR01018674.1.p1 GENE.GHRR01018674.1~~GHRR01018674.1.p1  ORF type:complete len:334 (+),score=89.89 GHRR01018674.1:860-1861(+)
MNCSVSKQPNMLDCMPLLILVYWQADWQPVVCVQLSICQGICIPPWCRAHLLQAWDYMTGACQECPAAKHLCIQLTSSRLLIALCFAVVFDGRDLLGVDESLPYTGRPMDYYTETKVAGEKLVLAANSDSLAVVALRPSGIFGEGDTVMVPTFVRQARAGKMKYIIGNGRNVWDFTYVGNVAQAHILAADQLSLGSKLAGQTFFITNQEPIPFWTFTGDMLEGLGYARPHIKLPYLLILLVAMLFEYIIRPLLKPFKELSTDFTVFRVKIVTRQRAFSSNKAKRLLGYVPTVSLQDGIRRTVEHFVHLRQSAATTATSAVPGKQNSRERRKLA